MFEGSQRNQQAQIGIEKLRANVDSLIVINNNKLRDVYGNLGFKAGFSKADEVLSTAAKGIAEVITHHYITNVDLRDAKTVLSNSGTAIMGSASASGSNRAQEAITKALDSPLLNDNKIRGAKNVLLLIVSGSQEITIDEIGSINDYIQEEAGHSANIIMGVGEDESKDDAISITIVATGFDVEQQNQISNTRDKKIIHVLGREQKAEQELSTKSKILSVDMPLPSKETKSPEVAPRQPEAVTPIKHTLFDNVEEAKIPFSGYVKTSDFIKSMEVHYEEVIAENLESFQEVDVASIEVDDFIIITPEEKIEQPVQEETPKSEKDEGGMLMFDLEAPIAPEPQTPEPTRTPDTPHTSSQQSDVRQPEVKRYTLEEDQEENQSPSAVYVEEEEETDKFLQFRTVKKEEVITPQEVAEEESEDMDPMNSPISKVLRERTEERKRSLKAFNYKFRDNASRIDKIEKEPAYKRQGIELSSGEDSGLSRTSINASDDDIELRSNNSFLHDNVD